MGLFTLGWAATVSAATNLAPTGPTEVNVGQTFQVVVQATGAQDVDTVRINGAYSQDLLAWRGAVPAGVFQNVSPGTFVDQSTGAFSFGAFSLDTYANGATRVATLTFKATKAGVAVIQLADSSRALSAGTDQLGSVKKMVIHIVDKGTAQVEQPQPLPGEVTPGQVAISLFSLNQPNPNLWYAMDSVKAGWSIRGKSVEAMYVGFDQSPEGAADTKITTMNTEFQVANDGVWYVHLNVIFTDKTRQRSDLRVLIDRKPPRVVVPVVDQTNVRSDIINAVRFGTLDDVSGVGRYDIYIDGQFAASTTGQFYALKNIPPGEHQVVVRAFDLAGNSVFGATDLHILAQEVPLVGLSAAKGVSWRIVISIICLLCVLVGVIWRLFLVRRRKQKNVK